MNRKGVDMMLIEVVSLLIFSITIVVWFVGIESLIGNYDDSLAVKNFNKFLQPIREVCAGSEHSLALNLDLNVQGRTFIVTQLKVPEKFRTSPVDFGMLPVNMKKCVGATCMCLMELRDKEGDWQMCTTSEFDLFTMALGRAPGCPFWYYAPPKMIEQAISNLLALIDIKGELATSALGLLLTDIESGYDRNYYSYPAPEAWGGCDTANANNIVISSFYDQLGTFKKEKVREHTLLQSFNFQGITPPNTNTIIEDLYEINDDFLNESLINYISKPLASSINNILLENTQEGFDSYETKLNTLNNQLVTNSITDFKIEYRPYLSGVISGLDDSVNELSVANNVLTFFDDNINYMKSDYVINSQNTNTNYYDLSAGNGSLSFNMRIMPEGVKSGTMNIYVSKQDLTAEELILRVNNKGLIIIKTNALIEGYNSINIPVSYLLYGQNNININANPQGTSLSLGTTDDLEDSESLIYSDGAWMSIGADFNAYFVFNHKYNYNLIPSNMKTVLANAFLNMTVLPDELITYLKVSDAFTYGLNPKIKIGVKDFYDNIYNTLLNKKAFDLNGVKILDVSSELRNTPQQLKPDITELITSELSSELSITHFNEMIDAGVKLEYYNYVLLKDNFSERMDENMTNNIINGLSNSLAYSFWPYARYSLLEELGLSESNASPIDALKNEIIGNYSSIIEPRIRARFSKILFVNELTNSDVKISVIESKLDTVSSALNNKVTTDYGLGLSDNIFLSALNKSINQLASEVNSLLSKESSNAIRSHELSAWEGNDVGATNCWLGPNGNYFEGYTAVNDLLAYNRYTSVSRIAPSFLFFDSANPLLKVASAGFYVLTGADTLRQLSREAGGWTVDEFYNIISEIDPLKKMLGITSDTIVSVDNIGLQVSQDSGITGYGVMKVVQQAFFEVAKETIKTMVKNYIIKTVLRGAIEGSFEAALNLPKGTVFLNDKWSEEIIYSKGTTRTFDPNYMNPVSCFTMEELGCSPSTVIWVNEEYSCYTELFMRNIGDISTWLKLILRSDECLNSYGRGGCSSDELSQDNICYRDTLTACYKMTCQANSRHKAFQYWVGASMDPASFGPPATSRIPLLNVDRTGENEITLNVPSEGGVPIID